MSTDAPAAASGATTATGYRGCFLWYDLMTSDPAAAVAFYTQVGGWGTEVWKDGGPMPYTMWTVGAKPMGGVMALPPHLVEQHVPPHWLAYIGTPDIVATCARAQELGATVLVPPTEIPTVGHFAVLRDPHGATFATFTPANEPPGHAGAPQVGEISWHELLTTDHVAAFDFYSALFGWEKTDAFDMGPMGLYQMYGRQGAPLGGMMNIPAGNPVPPNWLLYVRVPDITTALATVTSLGGSIMNGPMEVPGGDMVAQCMDPQGGAFALHATKG